MKAKVMIPFIDKVTGKQHMAGEILEITAARFVEITNKGKFVQPVDDTPATKAEKK